jgi:cell division protein FtsZ
LLETSIHGARGILISITASHDVGLEDVDLASSMISAQAHPDANVIWGLAFDDSLDDEMRVTIIATGFEDTDDAAVAPAAAAEAPVIASAVEAPVATAAPVVAEAAPADPVVAAAPVAQPHAPQFDSDGEDSSLSEDDFDSIMSIFRNRARRDKK